MWTGQKNQQQKSKRVYASLITTNFDVIFNVLSISPIFVSHT